VSAAATSIGLVGGERIASAIGKQFGIQEVSVGSEYQSKKGSRPLAGEISVTTPLPAIRRRFFPTPSM